MTRCVVAGGVSAAGIYRLLRPEGSPGETGETLACFAANVRPEESDLERTSVEEIRRRFPGFKFEEKEPAQARSAAPASNLWRYLLYAVIGFLAMESVMAWRFNRS